MKLFFLILYFGWSLCHADDRRQGLLELIEKEERTIRTLNEIGPQLQYRLLELESEKINLIKQKENEHFLTATPEEIKHKGRDSYFSLTKRLAQKAQVEGLRLIKSYPHFQQNAEVYYTLALNSRDYLSNQNTENFLLLALKHSAPRTPIAYSIQVALAEHYYNENQYQRAAKYYQLILPQTADEWHTKHLYNAAWCHLKLQDHSKAIEYMVRSHDLGLQNRYISMKEQTLESAQIFFVLGERVDDGIDFYLKNAATPTPYLIRMAKRTAERGDIKSTLKIVAQNKKMAQAQKRFDLMADIYIQELDLYRNFQLHDQHFQTATNLKSLKLENILSEEQKDDSVQKISEFVGYLQIRLTNNAKTRLTTYDPELLRRVIDYFEILIFIDPDNEERYAYFQGESYYAIEKYSDASKSYQRALEAHKKKDEPNDSHRRKILDSLLATIEVGGFVQRDKNDLTIYTYTHFLSYWPVDDKSQQLYRGLFNLYFNSKKISHALKVLDTYQKHYIEETDRNLQRAMLIQVIDVFILEKNSDALAFWVGQINQSYLNFPHDYTEKLTEILGQILFESYSEFARSGKRDLALQGYQAIFSDERYPQRIKAQASFQIAVIALQENRLGISNQWLKTSLDLSTPSEVIELLPQLYALHEQFFMKQDYAKAYQLADLILERHCHHHFENKVRLFKNSIFFKLLLGQPEMAYEQIQRSNKCLLSAQTKDHHSTIESTIEKMMSFFIEQRKYQDFLKFYPRFLELSKHYSSVEEKLYQHLTAIYWDSYHTQSQNLQQSLIKLFVQLKAQNKGGREISKIIELQQIISQIDKTRFSNFSNSKPFNEELFHQEFEANLANLLDLTQNVDQFLKFGHPEMTLIIHNKMAQTYFRLAELIGQFSPQYVPEGAPEDILPQYREGFKAQMNPIAQQLYERAQFYHKTTSDQIEKHEILTSFNHLFTEEKKWRETYSWQFIADHFLVPMTSHLSREK